MAKKSSMTDVDSTSPDEFGHFRHHFSITMELDKHPMLSAMALIAVGLIIYYVFKHGTTSAGITTATGSSTGSTTTTGGQPYISQLPNPLPVTITNTATSTTSIRPKSTTGIWADYDAHFNGVPLFTDPNADPGSSIIPFGTSVSVVQSGISGIDKGNGGRYSQIRWSGGTAYVATQDIANA